jgi:hypothetical protein
MQAKGFVALNALATVMLAAAVELVRTQEYLWACALAVIGIAAYAAYELIPDKNG